MSVGHVREPPAKRLNRSRCSLGADSGRVDPRNRVLDGGRDPQREGAIVGVIRPPAKAHWESLLRCISDRSVVNNGIPGGPKKVIPLVQCNVREVSLFWPTLFSERDCSMLSNARHARLPYIKIP